MGTKIIISGVTYDAYELPEESDAIVTIKELKFVRMLVKEYGKFTIVENIGNPDESTLMFVDYKTSLARYLVITDGIGFRFMFDIHYEDAYSLHAFGDKPSVEYTISREQIAAFIESLVG